MAVFHADMIARRFFYAKQCDVSVAHRQFKEASVAREVNQLCSFYDNIDVYAYEETRNLVIWPANPDCKKTEHVHIVSPLDWPQGQERPTDLHVRFWEA